MKFKKIIFTLFVMLIFSVSLNASVLAMSTGFSTESMNSDDKESFLSNIKISVLDSVTEGKSIQCLDVNKDGLVALGLNDSNKGIIYVYNSNGSFEYGYAFNCMGSFDVEWDGENLIIYFVRGDIVASFDRNAICMGIARVENTIENNSYRNNVISSKHRELGDTKYVIRNDMGILNIIATSYSQLVKIDKDGVETILYDINTTQLARTIVIFFGVLIFILIVVLGVIKEFKKFKKQ